MEIKIYRCARCGQMVAAIKKKGCDIMCCGQPVKVGSVEHPMTEAHLIEWILLRTDKGNQRKTLAPGAAPAAEFALLPGEQVEAVFAYCNLHGLWMA